MENLETARITNHRGSVMNMSIGGSFNVEVYDTKFPNSVLQEICVEKRAESDEVIKLVFRSPTYGYIFVNVLNSELSSDLDIEIHRDIPKARNIVGQKILLREGIYYNLVVANHYYFNCELERIIPYSELSPMELLKLWGDSSVLELGDIGVAKEVDIFVFRHEEGHYILVPINSGGCTESQINISFAD